MSRNIIDIRNRPAFLHEFYGSTPGTPGYETAKWLNRRVGSKEEEHFTRSYTAEGYVAEIQKAGINKAVVVGRETPSLSVSNDAIAALTAKHSELIGIGGVDPQTRNKQQTLDEIERVITKLNFKGINVEPGFGTPAVKADDALFLPIYEACQHLNVPAFIMSGPTTPDPDFNDPAAVARIARAFPNLKIVCHHGFYPKVAEIVGVAFRYENVFLVPDMYIFLPGSGLYVEAANGFMSEQLLFGSSFPFRPMAQSIEDFAQLGLNDKALERAFHLNSERVLGLKG